MRLGGVEVRRCSLHSAGHFESLGLTEGAAVRVRRSGDVIPQILGVVPSPGAAAAPRAALRAPTRCPACGGRLTRVDGAGAHALVCRRGECGGRAARALLHWADTCVRGLSRGRIAALFQAGAVRGPADLYKLTEVCLNVCECVFECVNA